MEAYIIAGSIGQNKKIPGRNRLRPEIFKGAYVSV